MNRPDLLGHLMEWLLAGPLPAEPEHLAEEPPDHVQPNRSDTTEPD